MELELFRKSLEEASKKTTLLIKISEFFRVVHSQIKIDHNTLCGVLSNCIHSWQYHFSVQGFDESH